MPGKNGMVSSLNFEPLLFKNLCGHNLWESATCYSYKVIKEVGDGTFGTVWRALNKQSGEVVCTCKFESMKVACLTISGEIS